MKTEAILKKYEPVNDNMLLILHELQNSNPRRFLEQDDLDRVARYLNTTRGEVYGVVKYYSMFSLEPRGKYIIRLCISPVCRMMGGIDILEELEKTLRVKTGGTTADGLFTLEHSECLGHCDKAPMLMVNEDMFGHLTMEKIHALIAEKRNEKNKGEGT
jgi:NADH:ubiquinone oxidoreductase subunit E